MSILSIMDNMQYISATDAKQTFSVLLEKAQREPVTITKQSRDVAVMLSLAEYERLKRLNLEEFQNFRKGIAAEAKAKGLTAAKLEALLRDDE
jgi:prevent-host-death family protein